MLVFKASHISDLGNKRYSGNSSDSAHLADEFIFRQILGYIGCVKSFV